MSRNIGIGQLRKYLRSIDIFGDKFSFSSFGSPSFQTTFGGIATILITVTTIIISLVWGQDFYLRKNPYAVTKRVLKDTYDFVNITKSNFTLAFRIETSNGVFYNETDMFIRGYYLNNLEFNNVSMVKCQSILNETGQSFQNQKINFDEWFCVNYDNNVKQIGGDFSGDYGLLYFDFVVDYSSLDKILDQQLIASILVPQAYYNIDNITDPLGTKYVGYSRSLDPSTRRFNSYYFSKLELIDDQAILFENEQPTSVVGLYSFDTDLIIYKNIVKEQVELCTISIYYKTDFDQHTRKFLKIQGLLANVGGFVQVIFYILMFLVMPYNHYKMETSFINQFFTFGEPSPEATQLKLKLISTNKNELFKLKKSYIFNKTNSKNFNLFKSFAPLNKFLNEKNNQEKAENIKETEKDLNSKEASSKAVGMSSPLNSLNFTINKECSIYKEESNEVTGRKCLEVPNSNKKDSCVSNALNSAINNSKTPNKSPCSENCNSKKKKFQMKLGSLYKSPKTRESKSPQAKKNDKIEEMLIKSNIPETNSQLDETLPEDKKFDFFSLHLTTLAQKKRSGFNLDVSSTPIDEIQDYLKNNTYKKKYTITFAQFFLSSICKKRFFNRELEITTKILNEKLDISHYLKLNHDVHNLKKILLNYYQSFALNLQAKPSVFSISDMPLDLEVDNVDENVQETLAYFINKDKNEEMSAIDYICIQDLEHSLRQYIFDKCPDIKMLYKN